MKKSARKYTPLVGAVRSRLRASADPRRAPAMQAYMKSTMPFLGVDAPGQQALWRELFSAYLLESPKEWQAAVLTLWRQARYREECYAAVALAGDRRYLAFRTKAALPLLEEMIVNGAWWDVVDALATHPLGDVLRHELRVGRGASMRRRLLAWARGQDLWKRRAAILVQLGFRHETDVELLRGCIAPSLLDEVSSGGPASRVRRGGFGARSRKTAPRDIRHDFFIRKAIGWAPRQHARVAPDEVRRFVREHESRLSPLSVREALKHLRRSG